MRAFFIARNAALPALNCNSVLAARQHQNLTLGIVSRPDLGSFPIHR